MGNQPTGSPLVTWIMATGQDEDAKDNGMQTYTAAEETAGSHGLYNDRLAEIVNTVLGPLSQMGASRVAEGTISGPTFGRMRDGRLVSRPILEEFAKRFVTRFRHHYGREIEASQGGQAPEQILAWLLVEIDAELPPAGGRRPYKRTRTTRELEAEGIDVALFEGARDLPPEDRNTLNAIVKAFVADRRKAHGLD